MNAAGSTDGGTVVCLLVQAGDHCCAIPITAVRRVVRALPLFPLAGASQLLSGLAEFGGEPLPVLDLTRLIDAPAGPHPTYPVTIVVWIGKPQEKELVGLAADAALEIAEIPFDAVIPSAGGLIRGEASVGGVAVRLLDLTRLGTAQ